MGTQREEEQLEFPFHHDHRVVTPNYIKSVRLWLDYLEEDFASRDYEAMRRSVSLLTQMMEGIKAETEKLCKRERVYSY